MQTDTIVRDNFLLVSEGIKLRVYTAFPGADTVMTYPSVQVHHAGGGYAHIYTHMIETLARGGVAGISMIHRGYPGSGGRQKYGQGEVRDIGNLARLLMTDPRIDATRMGIMGYSRGAHHALLAVEQYDFFRAAALWSTPVDMVDHVKVNPWVAEIIGGNVQSLPQRYHQLSAIHFVDRIECPLLLIHGEKDRIIPVRHTRRLAAALRGAGKPHELRCHSREGHIWSPAVSRANWQLTLDFFKRHLLNDHRLR